MKDLANIDYTTETIIIKDKNGNILSEETKTIVDNKNLKSLINKIVEEVKNK